MYDDEDGHTSWAELEEDPRLMLSSSVIVTAEVLEISLVGIENLVIGVQVVNVKLAVFYEATNSHLNVVVADYALVAFDLEEACEQQFEFSHWHLMMYEDVNDHASPAESEVDSAAVFCSCFIVAAQAVEVGLVGIEALPVAVGTHRIVH